MNSLSDEICQVKRERSNHDKHAEETFPNTHEDSTVVKFLVRYAITNFSNASISPLQDSL